MLTVALRACPGPKEGLAEKGLSSLRMEIQDTLLSTLAMAPDGAQIDAFQFSNDATGPKTCALLQYMFLHIRCFIWMQLCQVIQFFLTFWRDLEVKEAAVPR